MSYLPRLFCFCGGEMKNTDTGVVVEVYLKSDGNPYYKIQADIFKCVDCESKVFLNAPQPFAYPLSDPAVWNVPVDFNARMR